MRLPPCGPGENFPKLSCEVSTADSVEITSAVMWPVTVEDTPGWASATYAETNNSRKRLIVLGISRLIAIAAG
jgi:hypothetical protein